MDTDIDVQIVSLDDDFDPNKFDFALFGGGQDYEQTIVSRDYQIRQQPSKSSSTMTNQCLRFAAVINCLGNTTLVQMARRFRASVHCHTGLKPKSITGSSAISESKNEETGEEYHGFENHNGVTFLGEGERPLGKVIEGHGNNGPRWFGRCNLQNVFGTYFHGPVLARNGKPCKTFLIVSTEKEISRC